MLENIKNLGVQKSRNIGIKHAKGSFISFLDDDDEWISQKVYLQVKAFLKLPVKYGLVNSGYIRLDNESSRYSVINQNICGDASKHILKQNFIKDPLIKREIFKEIGIFDENFVSCQDWDLWIRICQKYYVYTLNFPLIKDYIHGNQISTKLENILQGHQRIYKKYLNLYLNDMQNSLKLLNTINFCKIMLDKKINLRMDLLYPLSLNFLNIESWGQIIFYVFKKQIKIISQIIYMVLRIFKLRDISILKKMI